ncbi:minor tail protein [Mycobacterium phage Anthony]|uniref:Minor tail protein n=1 Tax=Mycobacterium phage Anthony TaxID=2599857 RepID=A0A5J6TNU6_9CAUD|nr:minor tail protein [Mycobacterium phage Anthony]QFG10402.1 minor tail protein [Mycobacterium phage Anthony]
MSYPTTPGGALDAGGAFQIGSDWGQDLTEQAIKSLFKLPEVNIGNALDLMRDQLLKLPLEALEVFKPIIPDWIEDDFANVANAVTKILSVLTDPIKFLLEADWEQWITDTWNGFQTVVNQIIEILRGYLITPINQAVQDIKDWWTGLWDFRDTTATNQVNQQNFQISTIISSAYRNPRWVCRYPLADVTYPEFINGYLSIFGDTGPQTAGTAHTHDMGDGLASSALYTVSAGANWGGMLHTTNTTIIDSVAFSGNKDATVTSVQLCVLREDEDTGTFTEISRTDVTSMLTTTYKYIEVSLADRLIVNAGERYLVIVRNLSSTGLLRMIGIEESNEMVEAGFVQDGALVNKTSYTAAEVAAGLGNTTVLPWLMMASKNMTSTPRSFSDDANRKEVGGLWFPKSSNSGQIVISGNRFSYGGLTDGNQNQIYLERTAGDDSQVDGTIYGTTLAVTGPRCGLLMHCNRDLSQVVYLGVNNNTAKIYSGPWNSLTERASVASGFNDTQWTLFYDSAIDQYVALKDGQDIGLRWTAGTAVKHGKLYRYGGIRISRETLFNAGQVDNWTLRDGTPG